MAKPRFVYLLNSCQRRVQQWIARQPHDDGLPMTSAHAAVLFILEKKDGEIAGNIAKKLDIVPSAVTSLVERMVKQGLVERRTSSSDGRANEVWLTDLGRQQLPRVKAITKQVQAKFSAGFSDEEMEVVSRWLNHVRNEFE
tara:strand:- start:1380 stop:1802 length:423 start_codon:yes stop_codon:yes gene_type:complete